MKTIKLETGAGDMFTEVAEKASAIAKNRSTNVEFDFNDIKCIVSRDTDTALLYRDYSNAFTMEWEVIGPNCLADYGPEVQAELSTRLEAAEKRREKERKEYREKEDMERASFNEKVSGVEFQVKDATEYQNWKDKNPDPYGACCFEFAEGWAKLMQAEVSSGKSVKDCADKTSHELGFLGITGFMYGMAVSILSKCWVHGEDLRKWHNKEYGHDGDGVVNPAVMTITV